MKIILIGHTGFIGNNIYKYLSKTINYDLVGISRNEIDLTKQKSYKAISKKFTPETILIMCAGVKKQLGDDLNIYENNMNITTNFCRALLEARLKRIIYFSSASVYGEDVMYYDKISESTPVQPKSYYGIAKYTSERLIQRITAETKTELIILRPPLTYGKDDSSRGYGPTDFVYKAVEGKEIQLWGDGSEFREFVYVDDIGRAVRQLIHSHFNGILNLVSGKSYTFKEIVDHLNNIKGLELKYKSRERTKEKVDHHYSNELFKQVLGDFKFTDLMDGLKNMYQSIVNNKKGKK